ncbi:MAG: hypothetical protein R3Y35_14590 [Clostridia bacterium]
MIDNSKENESPNKESGMNFSCLNQDNCIYIEKSDLVKKMDQKVHIVEYIYKENNDLIFIEAKTSSPKQLQIPIEIKKLDKTETVIYPSPYIREICEKLTSSLNLFVSANLKIQDDKEKEIVNFIDFSNIQLYHFKFYLVIKNSEKKWLLDVQLALEKFLREQMKIWKIEVKVINEEIAKQYKLIS